MRHSIKRVGKRTLSIILTFMMVVSMMAVGIVTYNAEGTRKIYFCPATVWSDFESYTIKWNVNYGDNNSWKSGEFTDTGKTYNGNKVYVADTYEKYGGVDAMQIQKYEGTNWKDQVQPISSWTTYGNYENKMWDNSSSSWIDFSYDVEETTETTQSTQNYYVVGNTELVGSSWDINNPAEMTNNNGTYSITFSEKATSTTYEFQIVPQKGNWSGQIGHSSNVSSGSEIVTITSNSSGNIKFTLSEKSDVTITYTPSDGKIIISASPVVSDYNVSVEARYKAYNNSNQSYDAATETPSDLNATFTVNGGSNATVTPGDSVTLSASTSNTDKYTFVGWYTDAACNTSVGTTTPTPTANTTYYALYQQNTKNITYNVDPSDLGGAGFTSTSVAKAGVGSEVSVSAKTVTGYTSNITATGATISGGKFTVGTSDVTVTATYTVNSHTVTFASLTNGKFDSSTSKTVNYGETVTVVVTPNAGYKVDSVTYGSETATVNYTGDVATATFTMPDSDVEVNATFSKKEYTISSTVNESSMGSMEIKVNGNAKTTFNIGDAITIAPKANTGYECTSYTVTLGNGTDTTITDGSTYSVTINAETIGNIKVTATFAAKSYNVTYAGENCTKPSDTTKAYNSSVAISGFTANSGYTITGYTVTKTGDSSTTVTVTDDSFTMPAYDVTVTAIVKKQHTVTVTSGENGSVSPTTAKVTDGETVTLTATPADGYIVDTWTIPTGATLSSGTVKDKVITVTVTDDVTINVSFKESQDIVIYLAAPTNYSWSTMSVTQSINTQTHSSTSGSAYIVSTSTTGTAIGCDGGAIGTKSVNGTDRKVSYIVLPAECANWTSFYIGNTDGTYFNLQEFSGAPQYGYCYYANSDNSTGGTCAATTISSPKANDSETASCFVNDTVNLTSTVTQPNTSGTTKTAGGTTYHVKYIVTDESNNSTELDADVATWTPTTPGTYTITAKLYDDYTTFTSAETATVTVKTKTQSAVTASALNASVTITDSSDNVISNAYEGDTVKVTVTPDEGYMCSGTYAVTPNGLSVSYSNNVFTFTMPAQAVNLTIDVVAKELCSVSVKANDSSLGTATVQSGNIYVGDDFTVTATANTNCAFNSWTAVGAEQVSTSTSGNVTSATFRATAQSVTITANFDTYSYSVHTSSGDIVMTPSASDSNVLYSTDTVASGDIFRIKRTLGAEEKYSVCSSGSSDTWYFNNTSATNVVTWGDNSDVSGKTGNYKNNAGSAYYVMFDVSTGTVSLSETNDGKQSMKVYAKNGTIGGTSSNGETVAEAANTSSSVTDTNANTAGYKIYTVTEGSVVKVTTTVNDSYAKDYYVHAFVINGKTYSATAGTGNSYYAEFAVEEGVANYEVTPIYYVNDCKTEGNYITFYVDASEMGGDFDWGNTISSYAYAYTGSGTEANKPDGNYPGQPMLYDEGQGRYYARVPKVMGGKEISGITINNYKNDTVHASLNKTLKYNEQSYDFNDFKKIYDLNYDIIRFDMKPRNGASTNIDLVKNTFSYDTYSANNGWEAFVDNNGNKVDVLGNELNASQTKKLYVVSTASYNITDVGQWATKWYVYNQSNELVTTGLPSDFIPRPDSANNTDAYNAIVNGGYTGAETEITFENRRDIDGNSYYRLDGRWFYAMSSSSVSADVKYRTSEDGTTYGTPVEETSYVTINDAASVTFEKHGETIRVVARPIKGYVFSHWSIADAEYTTFRDLSKTLGSSFTTTLDAETHYVANYIKATDGNLVLSHLKYDGSDAKGGMGYYLIEAEIFDANGVSKGVVKGTGNGANGQSITLTNLSSSDSYIKVTITTVTSGENTFRYWYTQSSNGFEIIDDLDGIRTVNGTVLTDSEDPFGAQGTVTYTFETDVWKLFSGTSQIMSELNFYSDIAPVSKDYTLTYKYKDRFGNDKIYVVKGTHPDSYYTENGSWAPTEKLIYDNAPAIDDLYKDCTWTMENCSPDGSSATITAKQDGKKYNVTINNPDGTFNTYTLPINSYVKDNLGKFYAAPSTYNNKNFLYWEVKENGVEVARHFYSEYTLVVLGNYEITPIYGEAAEDAVYISKPQYTREQTTDANGDVKTDRLYVDFMVAYMSAAGDLIRNDASGSKYQTGVIIEIGQNKVLEEDAEGNVNTDYSGITYESNLETVEQAAKTANGTLTKYAYETSDNRKLYNFRATNTNYNNMNRLDYAVQFVNSEKNQKYVMKAYYYVIVDGKVILSNPVYFNLYEIGNSTPTTVTTTA